MNSFELKERINNLSIWKKGDQRAPHKPLLILFALGKLQAEATRFISYEVTREKLTELLREFGPLRKSYYPEEPFVRLRRDGIWILDKEANAKSPSNRQLLSDEVAGGFTPEVYYLLKNDPKLVQEIAHIILDSHFPETIHQDILDAVGLDFTVYTKKKRDPKFRERILRAYGYSCAVCGYNVRLAHTLVGVEAAHIKWHQAGGPDTEENGIALCSLHHKLFDRGVFTFTPERRMVVSQDAHGSNGFEEWLMRFNGQAVREPIQSYYQPDRSFIDWHISEVFKGPQYGC
ncbi:HNH endonuclease [Rossellomorea aquimaris]|uniref:phosphorothioated DNA-binding restriction endonuclease n=1 Tax=Rossellomorea aquimaris TaxID=189382 RepID=UPI001CD78A5B|nr:HNH endonuclease [Rossellomorea aquimaris]MCA1060289.1 HNH endonuclease [Rossellomorea aquimaris]